MLAFDQLAPQPVWRHFAALCAIPRPSLGEAAVRRYLLDWASGRGLATQTDVTGNLVIRRPASPDRTERPAVILQAHLDMVCQANHGVAHDFAADPIRPVVEDGWVIAKETTLGADNGIGVALALAALEDPRLAHPSIEALFTVDEETGMGGARGLSPGLLQGSRMLNLDTEEWGEFTVGCAGGCDVMVARNCRTVPPPAGYLVRQIAVSGLQGGHSGIDIHRGRGNANKLLLRLLRLLETRTDLHLAGLAGGTARNALPREARALVALPAADVDLVESALADQQALYRDELAGADEGVTLQLGPGLTGPVIDRADQACLLAALHAAPHGVRRMSAAFPGVVETSNNLGIMRLDEGRFDAALMVRSLRDSATMALAEEITSLFSLAGCQAVIAGAYPGWTPNPRSTLLGLCRDVYRHEFQSEAVTQVIHAGLECGLIAGTYPDLDIISFGPTIKGAHAPGERVDIASVSRTWHLLTAILAAL